ncbi:MAG TPA: ABC transporter ATP-binding protein [Methylomusa anaerophila]|uniref:Daunorubicin/doxorubicin resistance ATP-binding protein DrrA n=1 Tax=Methylomusa anaerophila TaxID=1930071 RepID=A0A348AEA3_9FIRM|nr:ABC transporter ATP-binding protein [Methylomusa anaerophila]BBB89401.1 daunorubicin/doxorubicin resistance ATP-binding protein DrrA [Methylomusa anaerophila]HML90478.1 ABC transporter ATP-binding protein [Methylomusa anaerophila]
METADRGKMPATPYGVQISGISKMYEHYKALNDVSLTVRTGEVFGLLGPNGAGKTTLMKAIAGLVRPSAGTIRIFGHNIANANDRVKRLVGLVPQNHNLERELTIKEALEVYGRLFGVKPLKQKVEQTIAAFAMEGMCHKRVGILSGGMVRRALIARALMPEPRLLLLDEPTVGLDPDIRQDIWTIIRQLVDQGITVIITTHYMEEAEQLCDRIAMLRSGRLALLDTPAAIRERFGAEAGVSTAAALEKVFIQLARNGEF